jgi:hypothetical protein
MECPICWFTMTLYQECSGQFRLYYRCLMCTHEVTVH